MKAILLYLLYFYLVLGGIFFVIFWLIPRIIQLIKNSFKINSDANSPDPEVDAAEKLRIEKKQAEQKELNRKNTLRERDNEVDPILGKLFDAFQSVGTIISPNNDILLNGAEIKALQVWAEKNESVLDFGVFSAIQNELKVNTGDGILVERKVIHALLHDEPIAVEALAYADTKLGIERQIQYCDGDVASWVEYETKSGTFEDVEKRWRRAISKSLGGKRGYIYILGNKSLSDTFKIGKTHRDPSERASELSKHSGVPSPFYVRHERVVQNCDIIEKELHKRLSKYRVSENREFFKVPFERIIVELDKLLSSP